VKKFLLAFVLPCIALAWSAMAAGQAAAGSLDDQLFAAARATCRGTQNFL
jgi:hypothetical protein